MDAQGGLDSLLGRLTAVLVNEAQLLGRVRGDVEFIKDEMESMNGLILHLTEAQHRDHQVRAWMKQVVGLTRDCEGNVELYVHYVGSRPGDDSLLGHLRRVLRFLRTIPVRHSIATRIRELKVRAQDVGDRRQRYGVTVPASATTDVGVVDIEPAGKEEDLPRRSILLYGGQRPITREDVVRRGIDTLVKMLRPEQATQDEDGVEPPKVRVFSIVGYWAYDVTQTVYNEHSPVPSIFDCKARSSCTDGDAGWVLANILMQVGGEPGQEEGEATNQPAGTTGDEDREKRLISEIQGHLKGKRFLILIDALASSSKLKRILDADLLQAADGCLPGSAIIMTTHNYDLALSSSHYKIIDVTDPEYATAYMFYMDQAENLSSCWQEYLYRDSFSVFQSDTFALKMFLHLLYVNPNRTEEERQKYEHDISECTRLKRSISKQVLLWCYKELHSKYRSCLLYLTVFPEGHVIRAGSLARRWVAEGLITSTNTSTPTDDEIQSSSTDEAEHCLDVLFTRGFVSPVEIGPAGNIKSCTVHRQVREFIARVAKDVNFTDSNLPPHLARYLSIHNRIGLQKSHSDGERKGIAACLPDLAASPQWQLLKVLDLEDCKGLKKKHIKSICKILLLKYLSLRNTDVAELPKEMKELQCLETLDIRQTKVRVFSKKAIVLPLLKHFLAGDKISVSNEATNSEESFLGIDMPLGIHRMNNLEILSHVQVTNSSSELTSIAKLLKLRKLGVALRGKNAKLSDLFRQIEQLQTSLRSLTVQLDKPAASENHGDLTPPRFIESLNISGLTSGLPRLVQQLEHLAKLTLTEAGLKEDDLHILGRLRGLRYLRLLHQSYIQSELSFNEEEFQALKFLLVGTSDVTMITFSKGAAPKLERIIWSFPTTARVSGLRHLPELWEFVLSGDCNPNQVRDEIARDEIASGRKFVVFSEEAGLSRSWIRHA